MSVNKEINTISDILCEFFEVVIHNILHIRKLYPESIFIQAKKYGVVVYRSVHHQLNEYIAESLKAVHYHSKLSKLKKLLISINSKKGVIERYVFDIIELKNTFDNDRLFIQLEQCLRMFCLKLHTYPVYLNPVPKDATFRIVLHTTEYSVLEFNENPSFSDFPWVQVSSSDKVEQEIIPLQSIETEGFKLQIFVEKCT